jgi:NAD-dependent SIR2 family protein deacetylase
MIAKACYAEAVDLTALTDLARGRRVVALTGAGCSTESGIPDYRGPGARPRAPMQHREFVEKPEARRRYWARSAVGWPQFRAARPNAGHHALAALERAGALAGLITQNVDGLHGAAGSREVVELHGALARVRCLACGELTPRDELQARLVAANARWFTQHGALAVAPGDAELDDRVAPDGDVELATDRATSFEVVACAACSGVLMPDVVFFGGSVPRATLDAAWAAFGRAELLLVAGSSLAVFSGYRFVRRAAERGIPIAIVNHGPTRGDDHASLRVDARCGEALSHLARALA